MALKVGRFFVAVQPFTALLHCVIRKLWKNESPKQCAATHCTQKRGPEVFPHLSMKYHKTETPLAPTGLQQVGCSLSGKLLFLSKTHVKMKLLDINVYFAENLICTV